ncbi:hypothetical protein D3C86_1977150 [compost metagenome]
MFASKYQWKTVFRLSRHVFELQKLIYLSKATESAFWSARKGGSHEGGLDHWVIAGALHSSQTTSPVASEPFANTIPIRIPFMNERKV